MDGAKNINQDHARPKKTSVSALLFDNLLSFDELVADLAGRYREATLRKFVREGMPREKISGRLYFKPVEVAQWIQRRKK